MVSSCQILYGGNICNCTQSRRHKSRCEYYANLTPAAHFKMMVNGAHFEYSFACFFEPEHLNDNRQCFEHIHSACHNQNKRILHKQRIGAHKTTKEKRACVTHEHLGRVPVEYEKACKCKRRYHIDNCNVIHCLSICNNCKKYAHY